MFKRVCNLTAYKHRTPDNLLIITANLFCFMNYISSPDSKSTAEIP